MLEKLKLSLNRQHEAQKRLVSAGRAIISDLERATRIIRNNSDTAQQAINLINQIEIGQLDPASGYQQVRQLLQEIANE